MRGLFAALGVECALLTASTPAAERAALVARLARAEPLIVLGTHALLAPGIRFARLALVAIDEQQRFGVAQRQRLLDKGQHAHLLLATATPIPRTLALSLYGELEPLVLRDKPAGRGALSTRRIERAALARLQPWLAERLADDQRAYWVTPRPAGAASSRQSPSCRAARSARTESGSCTAGCRPTSARAPSSASAPASCACSSARACSRSGSTCRRRPAS